MNEIIDKFEKIGASAKVRDLSDNRFNENDFEIDIVSVKGREMFDIAVKANSENDFQVLQIDKIGRHLLLKVNRQKFLCGHDERHWFVSEVLETASNINDAKEKMKPGNVLVSQVKRNVKSKNKNKRRNKSFLRQGEWFFIPSSETEFNENLILRKEPIRVGRSRPHIVDEIVRTGGETVYVSTEYPNGITEEEKEIEIKLNSAVLRIPFKTMRRNAGVFGRGKVRHPDHGTIELKGWHTISLSSEIRGRNVAFLD